MSNVATTTNTANTTTTTPSTTNDINNSDLVPVLHLLASVLLQESGMIVIPAFGTAAVYLWYAHWLSTMFMFLVGIGVCILATALLLPPKSTVVVCYWFQWWMWVVYSYIAYTSQATSESTFLVLVCALVIHVVYTLVIGFDIVERDSMRGWKLVLLVLVMYITTVFPMPYNNLFLRSVPTTVAHAIAVSVLMLLVNIRERTSTTCSSHEQRLHSVVQIHCLLFSSIYVVAPVALFFMFHAWRHDVQVLQLKNTTQTVLAV